MNDVMDMQVEPLENRFLNNLQQQLGPNLTRGVLLLHVYDIELFNFAELKKPKFAVRGCP